MSNIKELSQAITDGLRQHNCADRQRTDEWDDQGAWNAWYDAMVEAGFPNLAKAHMRCKFTHCCTVLLSAVEGNLKDLERREQNRKRLEDNKLFAEKVDSARQESVERLLPAE